MPERSFPGNEASEESQSRAALAAWRVLHIAGRLVGALILVPRCKPGQATNRQNMAG
jgi:hypothetical protein